MNVHAIYEGSDGDATKEMYARLEALGPVGVVAVNLFRAQKCSSRAKVYRGRGYKRDAYDRKNWALGNLAAALQLSAEPLGLRWGWARDAKQPVHCWVLYVDLPTGQVSFHAATRGNGPDYSGQWDGRHDSAGRVVAWVHRLLNQNDH